MNEILDQLRSTFATAFSTSFTTYFKGKQEIPAQDDLPILMVYPVSTNQTHSGTVRDDVKYNIGVEIQLNMKQYFDSVNGQGTKLDALEALMKLVEERESDGDLKTSTVMGIINANIAISNKVLYTDNLNVNYDPYYNKGEFPTVKATVTFTAHDRPNRT